jgi:hypothetical protein
VDNKDDDVGSKTEGAICSPRKVYSPKSCRSHGMRNEMHIRLKWLHRLVQCSGFFLIRDQKYPCLMEGGELGRMLSSQITDELKLVAHPVGYMEVGKATSKKGVKSVRQENFSDTMDSKPVWSRYGGNLPTSLIRP